MVAFTGGDKLLARLAEIAEGVSKASSVEIGFLDGSTYPDGTSVPLVAAMNEFGTEKSPSRPFFRGMVEAKSEEWPDAVGDLLVANGYDADKTLGQTGAAIKGQLQGAIVEYEGPPLSEATIARKGSDKQLIDTSVMLNSVDWRVK
nr:MAG TPA: virion morphogenesis protein [Caudoviricetes sp.]